MSQICAELKEVVGIGSIVEDCSEEVRHGAFEGISILFEQLV